MNTFRYPFPAVISSEAKKDMEIWEKPGVNLRELLRSVEGPIVELAGPTDTGYYFLDKVDLSSKPIITNIKPRTLLHGRSADFKLDKLVDARQTNYKDSSVGIVLSAHLPYVDEASHDFLGEITERQEHEYSESLKKAQQRTKNFADGADLSQLPLRLMVANESLRILRPGGFYLCDGTLDDRTGMLRLGFQELAFVKLNADSYYYMVLQKPQS